MELDERRCSVVVHETKRVNSEPLHHPIAARNSPVRHDPHHHVEAFRSQRNEIPERVMGGLCLWELAVRLRLRGMDKVGELDGVLYEEDRNVVSYEIEIAFLCIKLHGEPAYVARQIARAFAAGDGREAHENGCSGALLLQERGLCHALQRM